MGGAAPDVDTAAGAAARLHEALRAHWGAYRPRAVLQAAARLGLAESVARVHELAGDWPHSLAARLVEATAAASEGGGEEGAALLRVLEGALPRIAAAPEEGATLLLHALAYWERRGLPHERAAAFVTAHLEELAPPLARLMMAGGEDDDNNNIALRFLSPAQRLEVARRALADLADPARATADAGAGAGEAPLSALWTEIAANVPHEPSRRDFVVLAAGDAVQQARAEGAGTSTAPVVDAVVFTCGHQYTRRALLATELPRLTQRLEARPRPLPLTAALATAEYQQRTITLACPACLYAAIANNDAAVKPL